MMSATTPQNDTPSDSSVFVRLSLLSAGHPFCLIGCYGPPLVPVATVRARCGAIWALHPVEDGGKPQH